MKFLLFLFTLAAVLPVSASAATIRIITPYIGTLASEYSGNGISLKDTGEMDGLYAQWINTDKFQANGFYYRAPDVSYSLISGMHLNFDYYIKPSKSGKYVVGAGFEDINIDMSAGTHIAGLNSFDMNNDVRFYFLRAGRYFYYKTGALDASLLPYAGYAHEAISGDIHMDVAGPPPPMTVDISDTDNHPLAGINLELTFAHFISVQGKWMGRFKKHETLNDYSLMANLFLTRHWGLSYRYKYMEYGSSSDRYNLAGLTYCF